MTAQAADAISIKLGLLEISGSGVLGIVAVLVVVAALVTMRYIKPR